MRLSIHGLRRLELDQQSLHGQILAEHGCLTRQHFIKRRIPERTLLLALKGRMGVFQCSSAYPYICETSLTIQKHRPHEQTFEAITTKQMRIQ